MGRRAALRLHLADAPAGEVVHLQGADDPLLVVRGKLCRLCRVHLGQQRVQIGPPVLSRQRLHAGTELRVARRPGKEALGERLDVEARASHHQRDLPLGQQLFQDGNRQRAEIRHGEHLGHGGDIHQVVRHPRLLRGGGLRRAGVHLPVDLHRVGVDDLGAQGLRDQDAHLRLPYAGRAGQDRHRGLRFTRLPPRPPNAGGSRALLSPRPPNVGGS